MTDSLRKKICTLLEKLKSTEEKREYCSFEDLKEKLVFDEYMTKDEKFEAVLDVVCKHCIDTKSPNFMGQLFGGSSGATEISFIAEMIIAYFNTSCHTYESSPFFTLAEEEVMKKVLGYVGYDDAANGIFLPGSTICTTVGMVCARFKKFPESKHTGLTHPIQVITSVDSDLSVDKAAIMMGIGVDNIIKIDFEETTPRQLDSILKNNNVIMINSTFGTVAEGKMENLDKFAKVMQKHKVWHHIDASVGGAALFSDRYRYLTDSFLEADSITVDCHNLVNINQQCSVLLLKEGKYLEECSQIIAPYVFQANTQHDIGQRSFQCGRRADGFKLWFCDQLDDLNRQATRMYNRNERLKELVSDDGRFLLVNEDSPTHTCFRIKTRREVDLSEICELLRKDGVFINFHDDFFRVITVNENITVRSFAGVLDKIIVAWEFLKSQ